jgi:LytS/YehU family sensor histidine kinase
VEAIGLFADVMRGTLHHSGKQRVSLREEMALLQQYIQLETLQFADELVVNVHIADNVELEQVQIPGMLLQPLVENAIKHGLSHIAGPKRLGIAIAKTDNTVSISIDDNGIGRNRSAEINQHRTGHQSFATGSIEKRLALINNQGTARVSLEIIDKFENGAATGTLATLTLTPPHE